MAVPLVDLKAQYRVIQQEIDAAIARVLDSTTFIGGDEVDAFNEEFGAYCGAAAVGVASGTDALFLAARAVGLGPGDEVIVPAHTFIATAEAMTLTGARVVFADVDDQTYTLDPLDVEEKITPRTRALVAVHLYGQPAPMHQLRTLANRHGLSIIEDCAQAHGALYHGQRVGTLGDVAAFSFYPGKNLGAYGDAGAVVSANQSIVADAAQLANHGRTDKYLHHREGVNSRLDALQAAALRVKLRYLDEWNQQRQHAAELYTRLLEQCPQISVPRSLPDRSHVFHLYVVQTENRDALRQHLAKEGISSGVHYPIPLHLQPAYAYLGTPPGSLPRTERLAHRIVSLPIFPELTADQVQHIASAVAAFLGAGSKTPVSV